MPTSSVEIDHLDEPRLAKEFIDLLGRVAQDKEPVVLRRAGSDLAAVVPLEHLELLREALAQQEAEILAARIPWDEVVKSYPPPQDWFDGDEPKPF